jgi:hypothetical protein
LDIPIGMDPEYSHFYEEVFLEISHASRCCTSVVKKQERIKSAQTNIKQHIFTEKKTIKKTERVTV